MKSWRSHRWESVKDSITRDVRPLSDSGGIENGGLGFCIRSTRIRNEIDAPSEREAGDILGFEMVKVQNIMRGFGHDIEHSLITQRKDLRVIGAFLRFAVAGRRGLNRNYFSGPIEYSFQEIEVKG